MLNSIFSGPFPYGPDVLALVHWLTLNWIGKSVCEEC